MEVTEKKRVGNPNFGKKKADEIDKKYEFELIKTYEMYKPKDQLGRRISSVYPPIYGLPNKGVGYCEETKRQRAWRYINSESSIWVDEQRELSNEEEGYLLSEDANQLEFKEGKLTVSGIESNKLAALQIQDCFEGKKVQLKKVPRLYRLLNQELEEIKKGESLDRAFEAEKTAREVTSEDLATIASAYGINIEKDERSIRNDLILAAKTNPSSFLYTYAFAQALKDNVISATHILGQLVWGDSGEHIVKVNSTGNVAGELATRLMSHEEAVVKLYQKLQNP